MQPDQEYGPGICEGPGFSSSLGDTVPSHRLTKFSSRVQHGQWSRIFRRWASLRERGKIAKVSRVLDHFQKTPRFRGR